MTYHPLIAREMAAAHIRDLTVQASRSRLAALACCSRPGREHRPRFAARRPCPDVGAVAAS